MGVSENQSWYEGAFKAAGVPVPVTTAERVTFAKVTYEAPAKSSPTTVEKAADLDDIIERLAKALRQPGESYEQSFTRVITELPEGRRMFAASKQLRHIEKVVAFEKAIDAGPQEHIGPAHLRLHAMAVDLQKTNPGQSYASAQAYVYTHLDNVALREAVKAEHLAQQRLMSGI